MTDFAQDVLGPVVTDFAAMDQYIKTGIHSKIPLVLSVSQYVVEAGGKRMRPLMCLLSARACLADQPEAERGLPQSVIALSAIIEMLHTATLVHDDVVDESGLRRGRPTANANWNNQTAVLVGDFLIARSFDLLVEIGSMPLLKDFASGTCEIAEGEVLQLQHQHNPDSTEADYLQIIHGKTSRLFQLAAEGGAIVTDAVQYRQALRDFAGHFGNAFQIVDDILDYTSDAETLGKNIGDDLMEGKPTLPLISALRLTTGESHQLIRKSIQTGGTDNLETIIGLVHSSGALDYCRQRVAEETRAAIHSLKSLPESRYRAGLQALAEMAESRLT